MAVVFIPSNGIGLGHLSRAFAIAQHLQRAGDSPVIFAQGSYPDFMSARIPGISIGSIYRQGTRTREAVAREITTYARRTQPAVVIEDTHPVPVVLDDDVARILVIRPTTMEYIRGISAKHLDVYERLLVVDHPDSPTWPFSPQETAELLAWPKCTLIGPVFRRSSFRERNRIRRKYAVDGRAIYVFTMGGGGVQASAGGDTAAFCAQADQIGKKLRLGDPACRLLFVKGPLFPQRHQVPGIFEIIPFEPEMKALLALASGAVIRPGFNTIWECIAGSTPFLAIFGQTFVEPAVNRHRRLTLCGLASNTMEQWMDPEWRTSFQRRASAQVAQWSSAAPAEMIRSSIQSISARRFRHTFTSPVETPIRPYSTRTSDRSVAPAILIRIDDVTEASEELLILLQLCEARGLTPALDVIPYLCRLDEKQLQQITHGDSRYEVAQHGYAHLPRKVTASRKAEFPSAMGCQQGLQDGFRIMTRRFPVSFRRGLSAPYDFTSTELSHAWKNVGGRYLSVLRSPKSQMCLPTVPLTTDPWDWRRRLPKPIDLIVSKLIRSARISGSAGLVLHPQLLAESGEIERTATLLDRVAALGLRPALISEMLVDEVTADSSNARLHEVEELDGETI